MLLQRVITSFALLFVILAVVFLAPPAFFDVFIALVIGLAIWEWSMLSGLDSLPARLTFFAGLEPEDVDRVALHGELRGLALEKGYRQGWIAHQYKAKFGSFPPFAWNDNPALEPSLATRRWVKSRQIAWAKAQEKARATA
jgi:hypothetical protein